MELSSSFAICHHCNHAWVYFGSRGLPACNGQADRSKYNARDATLRRSWMRGTRDNRRRKKYVNSSFIATSYFHTDEILHEISFLTIKNRIIQEVWQYSTIATQEIPIVVWDEVS
jgi:hypothetical protein